MVSGAGRASTATCPSSATTTSRSTRGAAPTRPTSCVRRALPGRERGQARAELPVDARSILDAANAVIANNTAAPRQDAVERARRRRPDHPRGRAPTPSRRRSGWSREIARAARRAAGRWSDFAILYRSNLQAKLFEEELREHERALRDVRRPAVLRAQGGQGRDRVPPGRGQPARRARAAPRASTTRRAGSARPPSSAWSSAPTRRHADAVGRPARGRPSGTGPRRRAAATSRQLVRRARSPGCAGGDRASGADGSVVAATRALIDDIGLYDDLRAAAPSVTAAQRRIDNVEGLSARSALHRQRAAARTSSAEYLRHLSLDTSDDDRRASPATRSCSPRCTARRASSSRCAS